MSISNISEVKLFCSGCGACTLVCPKNAISLLKTSRLNEPLIKENDCINCGKCVFVCPSYDKYNNKCTLNNISAEWNNVSLAKGFVCSSVDENLRFESSSGGYITALLKHLFENKIIDGVITLKRNEIDLLEYDGVLVKDIESLMESRGSKYFPVSVCEGLKEIEDVEGKYAFVGKPCDIYAVRLLNKNKLYEGKLPLMISLFCHHTPERWATIKLLKAYGVKVSQLSCLNYRGKGWPGFLQAIDNKGNNVLNLPYRKAWDGYLSKSVPLVCKLCQDPFGMFADISVGDAWGFNDKTGLGYSAVIVRTTNGSKFHNMASGRSINCFSVDLDMIYEKQPHLTSKYDSAYLFNEAYKFSTYSAINKAIYLPKLLIKFKLNIKRIFKFAYRYLLVRKSKKPGLNIEHDL